MADYKRAVTLVPSDSVAIAARPIGIFVGVGGTINMKTPSGANTASANTSWVNVANNTILPIGPIFVYATGTTATNLIALY